MLEKEMTEQEAIELIATQLMGWVKGPDPYDMESAFWWGDGKPVIRACLADGFNPFINSNHTQMVKDGIARYGLQKRYIDCLVVIAGIQNSPPLRPEYWDIAEYYILHHTPNDVCMWAVVDVIKTADCS